MGPGVELKVVEVETEPVGLAVTHQPPLRETVALVETEQLVGEVAEPALGQSQGEPKVETSVSRVLPVIVTPSFLKASRRVLGPLPTHKGSSQWASDPESRVRRSGVVP